MTLESIYVAVWKVREFGRTQRTQRTDPARNFIAEIIGQFDLVAFAAADADLFKENSGTCLCDSNNARR